MYQNMYNQGMAEPSAYNPYEENNKIIKGFLSRPIVLVLACLFAISAVLTIVSSIMNIASMSNVNFNYSYYYDETVSTVNITWIAAIPALFYVLGFILMFFKSRSSSPSSKPSAGVTINWIVSIVMLAFACLLALFVVIILIFAGSLSSTGFFQSVFGYSSYYEYGAVKSMYDSMLLIIGIIFTVVMIYVIIQCIHRVRFYGAIRRGLNSAYLSKKGATAYGVMTIIGIVFNVIAIIIGISSIYSMPYSRVEIPPMFYVTTSISLIVPLAEAVFAIKYASYIRPYMERQAMGNFAAANNAPQMNMGYSYQPAQQPYNNYGSQDNSFNQGVQYGNPYSEPVNAPVNNQDNAYYNPYYNQNTPQSQPQEPENSYSYESTPEPQPEPQADTRCPMCGTEHGPNDMFCGSCGARLK